VEVHSALVESGIGGLNVLDPQGRRICVVVEVGLLVEHTFICPGNAQIQWTTSCIKAVRKKNIKYIEKYYIMTREFLYIKNDLIRAYNLFLLPRN